MGEAKKRGASIAASELWELQEWLRLRRCEIDRTFGLCYSVLAPVSANLLRDGRLAEGDLQASRGRNWTLYERGYDSRQ